jgi:YgjP-like, metallopeptidase domain
MEVEVTDLRVLPLGYRWGSCTAVGKLNIHWATMQLMPDLIDYVLVHELAHVRYPDHGADFWRAVERPLPGFAARRTRLRLTGPALWLPHSHLPCGRLGSVTWVDAVLAEQAAKPPDLVTELLDPFGE